MESEAKESWSQKLVEVSKKDLEPAENFQNNEASVNARPDCVSDTAIENRSGTALIKKCQTVSNDSNEGKKSEDLVLREIKSIASVESEERLRKLCCKEKIWCSDGQETADSKDLSEAVVKIFKPLCADYRSDSEQESVDSESDSTTSTDSSTDTSSEIEEEENRFARAKQKEKKRGTDLALSELPPIEDLKISVPENDCVEVGQISSIVETLVVVESYKGTAALDVDTVLFLDCGKRSLGKVFDILGPITEPVYTVRFNNEDQIKALGIEKGQKVYYAPKTQHTTFVFLSEVLKNKGSDASWKDNIEAPPEYQDFSDDEQEKLYKNKERPNSNGDRGLSIEPNQSRKRSFSRMKQSNGILQPARFSHSSGGISGQNKFDLNRDSSANCFTPPPAFSRPHFPTPAQPSPFPYSAPAYPPHAFTPPPPTHRPFRFSGPHFPVFGGLPFLNHNHLFHHSPFLQQTTHAFPLSPIPVLPPPPPPPFPPPPASLDTQRAIGPRSQENGSQ